ncbi:MAG: hypothetical protein KF805_05775 [Phycisphaeraceae bacterium]|nr:hypothetical protein [Phycisphaeraceae bacterium]
MTTAHTDEAERHDDPRVDQVQEEVMAATSPDGRPPQLAGVRAGWRRMAIIGLLAAVAAVALLFATLGLSAGLLATILLAGYVALTVPVWGAGLLRGQEERAAHRIAEEVVHPEYNKPGG